MSWAVDAIIGGARRRASARREAAREAIRCARSLQDLAGAADAIRSKIVATKEGGMITGEERLREFLAGLYGDVNGYEGRPTDSQPARAGALARELEDVIREFTTLTAEQLPGINRELQTKQLAPLTIDRGDSTATFSIVCPLWHSARDFMRKRKTVRLSRPGLFNGASIVGGLGVPACAPIHPDEWKTSVCPRA